MNYCDCFEHLNTMCPFFLSILLTAVRADRMRGGRNKFGPLYRRDRQMKQQRGFYHTANTFPCRVKQEGPQTSIHHDFPFSNQSPATPDHYHPPQPVPPSISQSEFPMLLDCTIPRDRTLTDPSLSFHTLYYPGSYGCSQEKRDLTFNYSPASTLPSGPLSPTLLTTPVSTPASTPSSTPNPHILTPNVTPNPSSCFLSQLLQAEPDEKQLCMRVLASLQREQACRGKHDRLNTFSIMCKMADQTLFGLVEWARNSTLFKDLKVFGGLKFFRMPFHAPYFKLGPLKIKSWLTPDLFYIGRGPNGASAELLE